MSTLEPIKKESVVSEVFNQMIDKIASGEWPRDQKIPSENELRAELGVSRDTVRQAIKRLAALGLLESQQGKGTFVRRVDMGFYMNLLAPTIFLAEDDGTELLQFMKAIQIESVHIAAERATEEDIAKLEECLNHMQENEDPTEFFRVDNEYHMTISRISGNHLFIRAMELASSMLHHSLTNLVVEHGRDCSIGQHRECLRAIADHDPQRAVDYMRMHYDTLIERLAADLKQKAE